MGFFLEMFGKRSEDFTRGVIAGIVAYAVWKDGKQVVGINERPLKEVIEEVKQDLLENPENFKHESWWY